MAMSDGGFAGGLARGLKSGWEFGDSVRDTYDKQEARAERKRLKEQEDAIAASIAEAGKSQQKGSGGGMIDVANIETAPSVDTNQTMGLQQLAASEQQPVPQQQQQPSTGIASEPTVLQQGGLANVAQAGQPPAAAGASMNNVSGSYGLQPVAPKQDPQSDQRSMIAGLSAGIEEAYRQKRPDRALQLMTQREKIAGVHREQAYGQVMSQYQLNNDPSVFVPFVNEYLTTGLKIDGIEQSGETSNGMPIYMLKGSDARTGKPFQQAVSGGQLNSFIQGVADPATQRAMFVDQAKRTYDEAKEMRKHNFKLDEISARGTEDRKTVAARGTVDGKAAAPSEVRTAQWLIDQGVAKDATGAWDLVRGARSKPREQYILETSRMLLKEQNPMAWGDARMTPAQAVRQAEQLYDSLGGEQASGAATPQGSVPATSQSSVPADIADLLTKYSEAN